MLREFANWILDFVSMAREIREHRDTIRALETRVRDLEEMMKLTILESRYERENLLLRLERASEAKPLPPVKLGRRKGEA